MGDLTPIPVSPRMQKALIAVCDQFNRNMNAKLMQYIETIVTQENKPEGGNWRLSEDMTSIIPVIEEPGKVPEKTPA